MQLTQHMLDKGMNIEPLPTVEFVNANGGGWDYTWFKNGSLLTLEADPWMMGDCATPDTDWELKCVSSDWDIYPRPSTDYVDNTIGIVLDPMAVYNSCLDDNNLACSEEELLAGSINVLLRKKIG